VNALDLLQTVAIISSILLGVWQVRAHTAQLRSSQLQSYTDGFNELNLLGFGTLDHYNELSKEYDPKTGPTERPFYFLGLAVSNFHNAYLQYKEYGSMTKEFWESQAPFLFLYLDTPYGRGWWNNAVGRNVDTVDDEFLLYIDALLKGNN